MTKVKGPPRSREKSRSPDFRIRSLLPHAITPARKAAISISAGSEKRRGKQTGSESINSGRLILRYQSSSFRLRSSCLRVRIVRRLLGNGHVVGVAFLKPRGGDPDKFPVCL
jgi:hypothetical protein